MKTYAEKTVTQTHKEIVEVRCDICGVKSERGGPSGNSWSKGSFSTNDTTVELEAGENYPDGGSSTKTSFDVCPMCFIEKLIPWFDSQGALPRIIDSNW